MAFRVPALLLGSLALFAVACDDGRDYPSNLGDGDYDLGAMALRTTDLPVDFEMQEIEEPEFNNELWAEVFDTDDFEAKASQLDAQGRLKNHVSAFAPPGLGRVLGVTAVSTLYTDEQAATESTERFACGLPINDTVALEEFIVPKIGDQTEGFFVKQDNESGVSFVETTICFRTGRIVHAIQQTSLPGVEDIALSVRLAQRMLDHVDDAFDGKVVEEDEQEG